MLKLSDFFRSSSIIVIERIKNPFFISLLSGWIFYHKKPIARLFIEDLSNNEVFKIVDENFITWSWLGFGEILIYTFLILIMYTLLSLVAYSFNVFATKIIKPGLIKWFDDKGFVDSSQFRELLSSLAEREDKVITLQRENRLLEEESDEWRKKGIESNEASKNFKSENISLKREVEDLKGKIKAIESKNLYQKNRKGIDISDYDIVANDEKNEEIIRNILLQLNNLEDWDREINSLSDEEIKYLAAQNLIEKTNGRVFAKETFANHLITYKNLNG